MSVNVPTNNDPSVALPPEEPDVAKVTQEQIELAKIGKDPNWGIITKYLNSRIEIYKKGLFGEDLTKVDAAVIGQRFLAAQSVIQEFESLIDQVDTTTQVVEEALADDEKS